MKSILLRAGLLTCLILLSCSYKGASAEVTWPLKCVSYGEIKPNQNPSFQHLNCLLTNAALEAKIPPEVVKAVATKESGWKQFDGNSQPIISQDGGIGLMQITNQSSYDQQRLKYDINYNIQAGVEILSNMYQRTDLPKIKDAKPEVIENWYFPVMAYNGTKPANSPLYQSDGTRNMNAYQEKVFALVEQDSFLDNTKLGQYPFETTDFEYDPNSDENIEFKKMEYILTDWLHTSTYLFQIGDQVAVTGDGVNLRSKPSSASSSVTTLAKNTSLIIQGNFSYDQSLDSLNQFVWYPVKTADQGLVGYISSAYIMKVGKVTKVNVATDKPSPQAVATPITLTATSEGSSKPIYKFYVFEGNTGKVVQNYSEKNTFTWKPERAGTYRLSIHAKDIDSEAAYDTYYSFWYKVQDGKVTQINVETDKPSPQAVATPITLTAISEGSSKPIYKFYVFEGNTGKVVQNYSEKNTFTWKPERAGTYRLSIHAKDINSEAVYDTYYSFWYKVQDGKVTQINVTTDKPSPQTVATPITLTAISEGSSKPIYRFYVFEGNTGKVVQNYSEKNTFTWKPERAGTYRLSIHAKDINSEAAYDTYYSFWYKVQDGKVAQVNVTTDKVSPQNIGTPVIISTTSEGSSNPEYRFFVWDGNGVLTTLQEYGANNATI